MRRSVPITLIIQLLRYLAPKWLIHASNTSRRLPDVRQRSPQRGTMGSRGMSTYLWTLTRNHFRSLMVGN